jgi:hypothetical protein
MNKTDAMKSSNMQRQELTAHTLTFEQWHARLGGFNAIPGANQLKQLVQPIAGQFEDQTKAA